MVEPATGPEEGRGTIGEQMAAIPYEPLLPVEKRLIAVSLILGVVLLGVLSWASAALFPIEPVAAPAGTKGEAASKTPAPAK